MYIPAWPSLNPLCLLKPETGGSLPFPLNRKDATYFYVARNGIYHLFRSLGFSKDDVVLAPDYHHGNEIFAIRAAGASIRYYPVQRNLNADLDALAELCKTRPKALYVTHFIGWPQPMDDIRAMCREHSILLIEDCALSFMSSWKGEPLGSSGDYSVFCLYKTLPLPNGGVLVQNKPAKKPLCAPELSSCSRMSVASRSAKLMLQWLRMRNDLFGRACFALKNQTSRAMRAANVARLPVGNTGFDVRAANVAMSAFSRQLLKRFHYGEIRSLRQRNFKYLHDRFSGDVQMLPLAMSPDVCPLFFPLVVKDKAFAARELSKRGIEVVEFWNEGDPQARRDSYPAEFLRRHVLEVPIHQDVTIPQLEYTADVVRSLNVCVTRAQG